VNDSLVAAAEIVEGNTKFAAVVFQHLDLLPAHFVGKSHPSLGRTVRTRTGRNAVVHRCYRTLGPANLQAARAQPGEGLR